MNPEAAVQKVFEKEANSIRNEFFVYRALMTGCIH